MSAKGSAHCWRVIVTELTNAGLDRSTRSIFKVGRKLLRCYEVAHCTRVGTYNAVLSPLFARDILQHWVYCHRHAVHLVVRSHECARPSFDDSHAKRNRVVLAKQPL